MQRTIPWKTRSKHSYFMDILWTFCEGVVITCVMCLGMKSVLFEIVYNTNEYTKQIHTYK